MVRIYLIRHGETVDTEPRRYKGSIDVPLSDIGIRQMRELADYIVQDSSMLLNQVEQSLNNVEPLSLKAVYCSGLKRAVQSAEVIARPFGLKPIIVPELRERNFGEWEGKTFDEIEKKYPEKFRAWMEDPLRFSPPGGESTVEVRDRAMKAMERIVNQSYVNIAIVAHGGINRIILCELLGIPLENIFRIEQDFGALNIIELHDGYPVVKLLNYRV
jgi:alpha-ribazole phosphatase/probable phosphoglycerate mutase